MMLYCNEPDIVRIVKLHGGKTDRQTQVERLEEVQTILCLIGMALYSSSNSTPRASVPPCLGPSYLLGIGGSYGSCCRPCKPVPRQERRVPEC